MKRELLFSITKRDLVVTHIRGSGPGGQHRNKTATGVRIEHPASGAAAVATDSKSQARNRKAALERLVDHPRFRFWHAATVHALVSGKTVDERVAESMADRNLRVDVKDDDGRWVEEVE